MAGVVRLVKGNRGDTLISAALIPQQEINLPGAGEVCCARANTATRSDFGKLLQIELTEKGSGSTQVMKYSYARRARRGAWFPDGVKMRFWSHDDSA